MTDTLIKPIDLVMEIFEFEPNLTCEILLGDMSPKGSHPCGIAATHFITLMAPCHHSDEFYICAQHLDAALNTSMIWWWCSTPIADGRWCATRFNAKDAILTTEKIA